MALSDPENAPPDASFDHAKSKQRYQVVRKDGKMVHRALLLTDGPEEVVLSEYSVKYVVGSGRYCLSYLVEAEGFLAESPLTWYASQKKWAVSPGFDNEGYGGFYRSIGMSCMICHVGQAEEVGRSEHRINFKEPAIGCERCHGPGALHVERHAAKKAKEPGPGAIDHTIVNPAHLPRSLAESICQDCHLSGSVTVPIRGRKFADFRPGLPLQDFRHDFTLSGKGEQGKTMTVTGHVEQMHLSRCYQADKTFSCLTCHDPHHEPTPNKRATYYKDICLKCHQPETCKVDPAVRHKQEPGNNCVTCHMPTGLTDIPHLAFTHHRVGIHDLSGAAKDVGPTVESKLRPILDLSAASDIDLKFSLGQGYVAIARTNPQLAGEFRMRALSLLNGVHSAGLRNGVLDLSLAGLNYDMRRGDVLELARNAEASDDLSSRQRCTALFLLAQSLAGEGKHKEAIPKLREVATLRRDAAPLLLLAECQRAVGDPGYVESLETAVRFNPRLWETHKQLADHFRNQGNLAKASYHDKRSVK
jgi:hypothetical protein